MPTYSSYNALGSTIEIGELDSSIADNIVYEVSDVDTTEYSYGGAGWSLVKTFTFNLAATDELISLIYQANVKTDNGAVRNHNSGRRNALIRASTVAAKRKVRMFFVCIPGTTHVAKPRPMAVAN